MTRSQRVRFPATDGVVLDGRVRVPDTTPAGTAVLCHPHPGFGGHMDSWLLPRIAERLAERGWVALRFDFRGVRNGGAVSAGACEEAADLAGACRAARDRAPAGRRCAVVGWSFGALVGVHHGLRDERVTDWVGIAPPTGPVAGVALPPLPVGVAAWAARRTAIVGAHDQFFPPASLGVLAPDATAVLEGADHFLFDRDDEVADLVVEALA